MFLFRFISFLLGYVGILVNGNNLEKFLNMAASRGIFLWDIKRVGKDSILLKARLSAVRPLRHIGRNTGSLFSFRDREGLPFIIARLKRRKSLIIGVALFFLGLYALSSFIWVIDIKGNHDIPREKILEVAAGAGLKTGAFKFSVDENAVEKSMREKLPGVYYVAVDISGTRATIEVAEKTLINKEKTHPASIVAQKAGLVKEVLVLVGKPEVKEGDTVVPGQILISGIIPPPEVNDPDVVGPEGTGQIPRTALPPTYVHARGVVRARVWYEGYGEVPLVEEETRETGNQFSRVCMKIGSREIILKGNEDIPFKNYRIERDVKKPLVWRNLSIPVEIITDRYIETKKFTLRRTRLEALELARKEALESARSGIPGDARVIEEHAGEVSVKNPEDIVRVRAYIETLEDIGIERPLSQQ